MMRLHYTGQTVLLADDVCAALLRYAQALAQVQSSDIVTIPITTPAGETSSAEFLLGPASQLYALRASDGAADPQDPHVVDDLERRARLLRPTALIVPLDGDRDTEFDLDLDSP